MWEAGSRSTPPFAVPPSSCTWKLKFAYPTPLVPGVGVKTKRLRGDVGSADKLTRDDSHTVVQQCSGARQRVDTYRKQRIRRTVVGVGQPEIGDAEYVVRILQGVHAVVRALRSIVDRGHINSHAPGRDIHVHATVGRAAVVLHLEGEASVARSVGIGGRGKRELACGDVGQRDVWPALTATPLTGSDCPRRAGVRDYTASRLLAGMSLGSLKPKSTTAKV